MLRPELLQNVEVVRKMSIEQKIQFWRDVMQYAHDRGIAVYWFTWNLFTFARSPSTALLRINPIQDVEYLRILCARWSHLSSVGRVRHHRR